jgi:hypothetical protein
MISFKCLHGVERIRVLAVPCPIYYDWGPALAIVLHAQIELFPHLKFLDYVHAPAQEPLLSRLRRYQYFPAHVLRDLLDLLRRLARVDATAEPSLLEMPLLPAASLYLQKSLKEKGAYLSLDYVVPVVVGAEATCDNVGLFRVEGYSSLNSSIKALRGYQWYRDIIFEHQ